MWQHFAQLAVNGVITGTILALTGVGATLVFGIQRIANFAHGEYLTFAAYLGLIINASLGQNLIVATLGAAIGTALLALVLHYLVLNPLRGRGLVAMSLITVGVGLMLRDIVFLVAGPQIRQLAIDQSAVYDLVSCASRPARPSRSASRSWSRRRSPFPVEHGNRQGDACRRGQP